MKTLTLTLDDESYDAAQQIAEAQKKSLSEMVGEWFALFKTPTPTFVSVSSSQLSGSNPELAALLGAAAAEPRSAESVERSKRLIECLRGSNTESVGRIDRVELYDRAILR
jgi:hypothetical protein